MRSRLGWLFGAWLVLVAAFILVTGNQMPATVASHFVGSGEPDAFMPRAAYLFLMCLVGAGLPLIMVLAQRPFVQRWPHRLNLPHREYWLEPQRRDETLRVLEIRTRRLAVVLSLLIAFAHWEVVQANLRSPPRLDSVRMLVAIGVFIAATGWWVYRLHVRFRRRQEA